MRRHKPSFESEEAALAFLESSEKPEEYEEADWLLAKAYVHLQIASSTYYKLSRHGNRHVRSKSFFRFLFIGSIWEEKEEGVWEITAMPGWWLKKSSEYPVVGSLDFRSVEMTDPWTAKEG